MKILIFFFLMLLKINTGYAQRLPKIQNESVLTNQRIKIDGLVDEQFKNFKAYNNSTSIFYTLANDQNNLYLIIKAARYSVIEKIIGGGITFTVKSLAGDRKHPSLSLTYPLILPNNRGLILHPIKDTTMTISANLNADLVTSAKEIEMGGFKHIADTLISIYNDEGIKVGIAFDAKRAYVYEMAIPLKLLETFVSEKESINYNIKLNGIGVPQKSGVAGAEINDLMSALLAKAGPALLEKTTPTDLSGNYVLAK